MFYYVWFIYIATSICGLRFVLIVRGLSYCRKNWPVGRTDEGFVTNARRVLGHRDVRSDRRLAPAGRGERERQSGVVAAPRIKTGVTNVPRQTSQPWSPWRETGGRSEEHTSELQSLRHIV